MFYLFGEVVQDLLVLVIGLLLTKDASRHKYGDEPVACRELGQCVGQ